MSNKATTKGYIKVPNKILTMLTGENLRAWLIIRSKAEGFIVSKHYLTKELNLTERTVCRILADLNKAGMLETTVITPYNGRPFNSYTAVLPDEEN